MALTATQQYARKMSKRAVPDMIRSVTISTWCNLAIIVLIMFVTYGHSASYLATYPAIGIFAWIIPAILDLSILVDTTTLMTVGMAKKAKTRAMITLTVATLSSAGIQVMAPGEIMVKAIFAVLVGFMALRKWAASAIKPDFAEMDANEREIAAATKPKTNKCPKGCTCGRHNRVKVPSNPVAAVNALRGIAPTSPAPAGARKP